MHDSNLLTQVRYGYFSFHHDQSYGSCIVLRILSVSQIFMLLQTVNSLARADLSPRGVLPSIFACVSLSVIKGNNHFCTYSEWVEGGHGKKDGSEFSSRKVGN